jgi:hypothetical protein
MSHSHHSATRSPGLASHSPEREPCRSRPKRRQVPARGADTCRVSARSRRAAIRLAALFAIIPVAYVLGLATHSRNVFLIVMVVGLVIHTATRFTRFL